MKCERCNKEAEWLNSHNGKSICISCIHKLSRIANWNKVRVSILKRDNYICQICKKEGREVHHIIPKINGGGDNPENLITLCFDCHDSQRLKKKKLK